MPARRKGGETASVSSQKTPACLPLHFRLDAPPPPPRQTVHILLREKKAPLFSLSLFTCGLRVLPRRPLVQLVLQDDGDPGRERLGVEQVELSRPPLAVEEAGQADGQNQHAHDDHGGDQEGQQVLGRRDLQEESNIVDDAMFKKWETGKKKSR